MALLQQWRDMAYDQQADKAKLQQFWAIYFTKEKDIYAELLKNPDELVRGTVKELAEKFGVDIMTMTGFLDGINDSLKAPNPIEEMEEDTVVNLGFDKALLYKNMVAADADWLYELEEWNDIFDEESRASDCPDSFRLRIPAPPAPTCCKGGLFPVRSCPAASKAGFPKALAEAADNSRLFAPDIPEAFPASAVRPVHSGRETPLQASPSPETSGNILTGSPAAAGKSSGSPAAFHPPSPAETDN